VSGPGRLIGKVATERVLGLGPGRLRAGMAAAMTGTIAAVATYRLLRSHGDTA
jgi:hypothetical protein